MTVVKEHVTPKLQNNAKSYQNKLMWSLTAGGRGSKKGLKRKMGVGICQVVTGKIEFGSLGMGIRLTFGQI